MDHANNADARRVAELLKAFAYLALAVFFLDGMIGFINDLRNEMSFSGFVSGSWELIKSLFRTGILFLALLGAAQVILLLLDIKASHLPDRKD